MTNRLLLSCLTVASAVALGGCVDPEGKYDEFAERAGTTTGTVGSCDGGGTPPNPGEGEGPVLLVVSTSLSPKLPVLFKGDVQSVDVGGKTGLTFNLSPLNAFDRSTPVGEPLNEGPFVIGDDGVLVAEIARGITPEEANPILPDFVESQVTLTGTVCKVAEPWSSGPVMESNSHCGIVSGTLYHPIPGDLAGDFVLIRLADVNVIPDPLPYNCNGDLADPAPPPRP